MIQIVMIRQDTRHPDKRRRHPSRCICEVDGRRYSTEGPAPIYRMASLLWLNGFGGKDFEVYDDRCPSGDPGGLAMVGRVRNFARIKGRSVDFRPHTKPNPTLTPLERQIVAKAAGSVVPLDEAAPPSPGLAPLYASLASENPERPRHELAQHNNHFPRPDLQERQLGATSRWVQAK